jgi:16S rRNA (cytosine1402-N4)-methyltransferase
MKLTDTPHQPVLLKQVLTMLAPKSGGFYLDGTAGYGGHAAAIMERLGPEGRVVLVDRDANATQALRWRFEEARIIHASFLEAAKQLLEDGNLVDMVLLDLGVSSPQFDNPERGFSFRADASLDMRMDQSQSLTAAEIVNGWPVGDLEAMLRSYGEEPRARAVARAIVAARPLATTLELARAVRRAAYTTRDIDPATRTFQALRIAVNGELEQLEVALPLLAAFIGRMVVISFHSLEDRIVKQFFDHEIRGCICPPKQPICTCGHVATLEKITRSADPDEIVLTRALECKARAAENKQKQRRTKCPSKHAARQKEVQVAVQISKK